MQTFLPYPDLVASSRALDDRRLGKQRVETFQILRALTWPSYAWKNHPAVRMWRGFVPGLVAYGVENCREWTRRGHRDSVLPQLLGWAAGEVPRDPPLPPWFGLAALHRSHRSALVRKDEAFYRPLFLGLDDEDLPADLPYVWPPDLFPRWPIRPAGPVGLPEALRLLGMRTARPGQAEAVALVAAGRDCVLHGPSGSGGSTAGLLAGLVRPGRTLVVRPPLGPAAPPAPPVPLLPARTQPPRGPAAAPTARLPGPEDLAAMAEEAEPTDWVFAPEAGTLPEHCGLVVLDGATGGGLAATRPPVLLVVPQVPDPATLARLGLRDSSQVAATV